MTALLNSESTLTDRYQTTVPEVVRQVLGLGKRDKIHYLIYPNGQVVISRAAPEVSDPVLEPFLNFLAQDIASHPQNLQTPNPEMISRIQSLVADVEVDLDAPLSDEDE